MSNHDFTQPIGQSRTRSRALQPLDPHAAPTFSWSLPLDGERQCRRYLRNRHRDDHRDDFHGTSRLRTRRGCARRKSWCSAADEPTIDSCTGASGDHRHRERFADLALTSTSTTGSATFATADPSVQSHEGIVTGFVAAIAAHCAQACTLRFARGAFLLAQRMRSPDCIAQGR